MDVKIETATKRMLDRLYEIEQQSFHQEAFSKRMIGYLLEDYNSLSLVARVNDEVVAFAIGRLESEDDSRFGHIFTLETLPAFQRRGIAKKLLTRLETFFIKKGAGESRLEVREDNFAAITLYQKLGYQQVGRLEGYYGKAPGLYLKKKLQLKKQSFMPQC